MILLTLIQSSIQMKTAVKKSREAWKGNNERIGKDQEQRCIIRDQG